MGGCTDPIHIGLLWGIHRAWRLGIIMAENILACSIYGKVARFNELAPTAVPIRPNGEVTINGTALTELLFGDSYAAFTERALRAGRFTLMLVPHDVTDTGTFNTVIQSFLNSSYLHLRARGELPKHEPDLYGIIAPAAKSTKGWPVYFFAVGIGLRLPKEAYRGKVALPKHPPPI